MSQRAWAYVLGVPLLTAVVSILLTLSGPAPSARHWLTLVVLVGLATLGQLFEAEAPNRQSYYPAMVFFFAGVLLLPPGLFVLVVAIPHLIEWAKHRLTSSPRLRAWYIQPFNIATHLLAGFAAQAAHGLLGADPTLFATSLAVAAALLGALSYVLVNHLLIGQALVLARGLSWRESGVLAAENLLTDLVLMLLGFIVAVLWQVNPLLIVPALSPLVLIYRALFVPQLQQEAHTDAKTGLLNARHFTKLFAAELERARRFTRPLALIVADLDLLRNVNNTYGHLAGDAVLAEIGRLLRQTVREYDIAARFGGEEFVIALPETEPAEARRLAERLRQTIEAAGVTVPTSPVPIGVTMSLGVACYPGDAIEAEQLIHAADVAVYQAKLQGRNRVVGAADVPSAIAAEPPPGSDGPAPAYGPAFVQRRLPVEADGSATPTEPGRAAPTRATSATASADDRPTATPVARTPSASVRHLFVSAVIAAGVGITLLGVVLQPQPDLTALVLLTVLALLAEWFQIDVYGEHTVSVSGAVVMAAALSTGVPGVAVVSAAIAAVHCFQRRPPLSKAAFNWATHLLAGVAPVLAVAAAPGAWHPANLPLLLMPALGATLVYYVVETGLIVTAMSLAQGTGLVGTWREQFRWLAGYYLVLGILGLFLSVAYSAFGWAGVLLVTLPVLMMRYAQKQYVERTSAAVRELKRLNGELTRANRSVVATSQAMHQLNDELFLTLAKIVDARDRYVASHAIKAADYALAVAAELRLPAARLEPLRQAAFLHDIGKIAISEQILGKPGKLTAEEYEHMKTHAALGADFLATSQGLRHLAPFVRHHHERWDGSGYPDGLCQEQIPLEARILAVCDAVEAMASDRPYRPALPLPAILGELHRCAGTQFDPTVVAAFVRVVDQQGAVFVINSAQAVTTRG